MCELYNSIGEVFIFDFMSENELRDSATSSLFIIILLILLWAEMELLIYSLEAQIISKQFDEIWYSGFCNCVFFINWDHAFCESCVCFAYLCGIDKIKQIETIWNLAFVQ